jgi:hypothetical protein
VLALYGEVTTIAAPGGFGKTAFAVGLALEGASGRSFLGHHVFLGRQNVLHISAEESGEEMKRRYKAAARWHEIAQQDADLIAFRGADATDGRRIELLTMDSKGKNAILNTVGLAMLQALINNTSARIVILDPLNSFLAAGLNDNLAMRALIAELQRIAAQTGVAVIVLHHTRKDADIETTDAIMGAAAIANSSRTAITLVRMTAEEAKEASVPPSRARDYFRLNYGKVNYAYPADEEQWFRQCSVNLGNATQDYPEGDKVGVAERCDPAARAAAPADRTHDRIALKAIASAPANGLLRLSKKSSTYFGVPVRRALKAAGVPMPRMDAGAMVERLIDGLLARGLIHEGEFKDTNRRKQMGLKLTSEGQKLLDGDDQIAINQLDIDVDITHKQH